MRQTGVILFFILLTNLLQAQTTLDANPARVKFSQINTPHFKIIIPDSALQTGARMANTLEHLYEAETHSLRGKPKKIRVLLQTSNAISNGFVSMLPRRVELYTMPPQDNNFIGTNDWMNLLAVHEYRHVVQYEHARRGFNKFLYYTFGNYAFASMAQAAAPSWFWEGDAVALETALTPSGRGRIPRFGLLFRTNLLEGRNFNYHKQYLRSYKHQVPNQYVLGFHMVNYLREKSKDPLIWDRITARAWSVPFVPFTFSLATKKESGLYITGLYKEMAQYYKAEWERELASRTLTDFKSVIEDQDKAYTDYLYPRPLDDGSVIALRNGIGRIDQIVRITPTGTNVVHTTGVLNESGMISANQDFAVWNEYGVDPRWPARTYSRIKVLDLKTRQTTFIGFNGRYSGAAISQDSRLIATTQTDRNYKHQLVILNRASGSIRNTYETPENFYPSMPSFDDTGVLYLLTGPKGKTLQHIDLTSGTRETLIDWVQENLGNPVASGAWIFFNSSATGTDEIHAIHKSTKDRYVVTSSRYGSYNAAVDESNGLLYYSTMTRNGLRVVKMPMNPTTWSRFAETSPSLTRISHLIEQEKHAHILDSVPSKVYPVTSYSKLSGLVNPMGWGLYVNSDLTQATAGISSQNVLSTIAWNGGYTFDLTERTQYWKAGLSYQGWYPILDVNFVAGDRREDLGTGFTLTRITGEITETTDQRALITWQEQSIEAGLRLPFRFINGKYQATFEVATKLGLTRTTGFSNGYNSRRYLPALIENGTVRSIYPLFDYPGNGDLTYSNWTVSYTRLLKQSRRDINSRWGQAFYFDYSGTLPSSKVSGGIVAIAGYLFFPGLGRHHSLWGYVANQTRQASTTSLDVSEYLFRNQIPGPRGLGLNYFRKLTTLSGNYTFPIAYPDLAIGPVLNLQRIRANAFIDYAMGIDRLYSGTTGTYISTGIEVKLDLNVMRFLPQLDVGFRYVIGLQPEVSSFELLLGTFNF